MSLAEPTKVEKAIEFFRSDPRRRILLWAVLGLVVLGGLLFMADKVTGWRDRRAIEQKKAEINAAIGNLANAQNELQRDRIAEAVHKQDVINRTEKYLEAVNATDAARAETNRALENLNSAVSSGRNAGITADALEKRLNEINP